jgi:hypothetical protein
MNNWLILAIAVVIAAIGYYMLRKKTVKEPGTLAAVAIPSAPGVTASTGQVPPADPLPPPHDAVVSAASPARQPKLNPAIASLALGVPNPAVLSHIPVVGGALSAAAKVPTKVVTGTLNASANILSHVPIVGGIAAAPVKVASKAISSVSHFFGF